MPDSISFVLDSPVPPKLDLSGAQSQLFQLPQTPSASSSLYRSISSSRKRARYDRRDSEKPEKALPDSPSTPHISSHYQFPRNRDQPSDPFERPEPSPARDSRPDRSHEQSDPAVFARLDASLDSLTIPPSSTTDRKRSRSDSSLGSDSQVSGEEPLPSSAGWGQAVITAVNKVWNFCWTGAFRGFYAGGGRGYDLPAPQPQPQPDGSEAHAGPASAEKDSNGDAAAQSVPTALAGRFPDEDLQRGWVVVRDADGGAASSVGGASRSTPSRRVVQRKVMSPVHARRRLPVVSRLGQRTTGFSPSGRPVSPAKSQACLPSTKLRDSPAAAETQRVAAQQRRLEREEDASLRRLNRQLQAMIREGKEALGSRVEVEVNEMDWE